MKILLLTGCVILLVGLWQPVSGHVALTFPPARKYDLDFLDTFRTTGNCGMNKGSVKTTLEAGKTITVTWHLGYPHRGGFTLELLDQNGNELLDLTPNDTFVGSEERTHYEVKFDKSLKCTDCTIRLERQALEWGAKYRFKSCADVSIVGSSEYVNTCSDHGRLSGSSCQCDHLYYGDFCQYKYECESDSDCNNRGRCMAMKGHTALPLKQCYCEPGYMGFNCEAPSSLTSQAKESFHPALYTTKKLGKVEFMYRYVNNDTELEGLIVGKSTSSYLAFGWRPSGLPSSCQKFPEDARSPKPTGALHGMDCTDIVIGTAKGNLHRVGDYYTRDRSTPRPDTFYNPKAAKVGFTGALAWEEDGDTMVMFRKKIKSDDNGKSDHDLTGKLHVIWAYGQADQDFYRQDEIKYHGRNKGVGMLELNSAPPGQLQATGVISSLSVALTTLMVSKLF